MKMLTSSEHRGALVVLIAILIMVMLEDAGVVSIMPLIALLSAPHLARAVSDDFVASGKESG